MANISGTAAVQLSIALLGGAIFTKNFNLSIFGVEYLGADVFPASPSGAVVTLPLHGSTAPVTAAVLTANVATYTAVNTLSVGQNVTVTGCTTATFNVSNQPITAVSGNSFSVGITHADIASEAEPPAALATTNGISFLYLRSLAAAEIIKVNWAGAGLGAANVLTLEPGDTVIISRAASGSASGDPVSLTLTSGIVAVAPITNATLTSNVATYASVNNFSVGQLVTITGCTSPTFNVTAQPIASATATQFTVNITHANIGSEVESGADASVTSAAPPQVEYVLVG